MDPDTLREGVTLALCILPVAVLTAWLFRPRRPRPNPMPLSPTDWNFVIHQRAGQGRVVIHQRAGHVFVVIYHVDRISEAISHLGKLAGRSKPPMNFADVDALADGMLTREAIEC